MDSLDVIIKQMILSAFRSAEMDSASPGHINHFKSMKGDIIGSSDEINAALEEALEGFMVDPNSAEKLAENLLDSEEKTGKKKGTKERQSAAAIKKTIGGVQDPTSMVAMALPLLPHAVLISFAIMLAPLIFDVLTKPGGPLDLRFKRIIDEEINAFLSRQTQKDTEMGIRQVVIQSKTGFTAANGKNNYNTVRGIREGGLDKERLDRIGMTDHSKGVFD